MILLAGVESRGARRVQLGIVVRIKVNLWRISAETRERSVIDILQLRLPWGIIEPENSKLAAGRLRSLR
jgi:hypothetical protein